MAEQYNQVNQVKLNKLVVDESITPFSLKFGTIRQMKLM